MATRATGVLPLRVAVALCFQPLPTTLLDTLGLGRLGREQRTVVMDAAQMEIAQPHIK